MCLCTNVHCCRIHVLCMCVCVRLYCVVCIAEEEKKLSELSVYLWLFALLFCALFSLSIIHPFTKRSTRKRRGGKKNKIEQNRRRNRKNLNRVCAGANNLFINNKFICWNRYCRDSSTTYCVYLCIYGVRLKHNIIVYACCLCGLCVGVQ